MATVAFIESGLLLGLHLVCLTHATVCHITLVHVDFSWRGQFLLMLPALTITTPESSCLSSLQQLPLLAAFPTCDSPHKHKNTPARNMQREPVGSDGCYPAFPSVGALLTSRLPRLIQSEWHCTIVLKLWKAWVTIEPEQRGGNGKSHEKANVGFYFNAQGMKSLPYNGF